MDFLDNLVVPQSAHHMVLLKYILGLTLILLIPYLSVLLGTTFYSVYFNWKGRKKNNSDYLILSKDLIDIVTFNKSISFGLGLIPLLSAVFCYAQLLHQAPVRVPEYLFFTFIFLVLALISIYAYKYSLHVKSLFDHISNEESSRDEKLKNEVERYKNKAANLYLKSGFIGLALLFIATYIFAGTVQLAVNAGEWGSVGFFTGVIFSWSTISYFLHFLAGAFSVTSAVILYYYFRPTNLPKGYSDDYLNYVKKFALYSGLIFTITQPVLLALNIFSRPQLALSSGMFGMAVIILFTLMLLSNMFYVMIKESKIKFSASMLYIFVILFVFIVIKDQLALDTATKKQFTHLSANYEEYAANLRAEMGVETKTVSGPDIFNSICSACHSFDKKIVGPPYNTVLDKYVGKKQELVNFILNPQKMNPDYPAMPNQGLKKSEAEAVADFLLTTYKQNQ